MDALTVPRLDEAHLKARVLSKLRREGIINQETVIASEFRLGNAPSRADLALFGRNFIGVEIKSQFDTLRRLEAQLSAYSKRFERSILVIAERHARAINLESLGATELWTVDSAGRITLVRNGLALRREVSFAPLMTLDEQRRFLRPGSAESDRSAFYESFKARYGETSARFWRSVRHRRITEADIAMLSRYRESRERQAQIQQDRDERQSQWCAKATEFLRVA